MQQLVEIGESEISRGAPRCPETGLHVSLLPLIDHPSQTEWKDLASRALVPNIFYEAEYAVPAAVPFGPDIMLLTVTEGPSIYSRMLGAWPVRISSRRWGIPLRVLVGWTHPFAALGVPLLDRERALDALRVLLTASRLLPGIPTRILLPNIPEDGPFAEMLGSLEREHGLRSHRYNSHVRAKMLPKSRKDYFESHLSARTRSKLRQQFRRIEKCGATVFETISEPSAVTSAVEDYIALEGRGWKARAGTAITCSASEADFLRQATANLAATRRVKVHRLVLNGTTIASSLTYLSPSMAWYAKISFDESQAKNSPGSQLVMHATDDLLQDPAIDWADSCAPPDHPLMRKFWFEDLPIANRLIDGHGPSVSFLVAAQLENARTWASKVWSKSKEARRGPA